MIQLSFNGALNEVGRSAILVDTGVEKIVLDYGTKVREVPQMFPIPVKCKPDAVFLSHSHLDHSGALALFAAKDNGCHIYAIDVTKPITEMLLLDSVKIGHEEGVELPFTIHDVKETVKNFVPANYTVPVKLRKTAVTLYDAGHIPGSAMVHMNFGKSSLLYTGDFKTSDTRLLKRADENIPETNVLVTESTYAQRDHPDRKEQEKELIKTIRETLSVDGVTIIAGFAVGRIDEMLLVLDHYGIDYPVFVDGMAKKALTIINKHHKLLREPDELDTALKKVQYIKSENMRKRVIKNPCVVLTTSGMLSGGPIVQYIKKLYNNKDCSLILTSYQCVTGNMNICLNDENKEIEDIFKESKIFQELNGFEIRKLNKNLLNFDINKKCLEIDNVKFVARKKYEGEIIKITTTDGNEITLSSDHPVLTKEMIWKKARELNTKDEILVIEK